MVEGEGWVDTSDGGCAIGWAVVGRPRRGADGLRVVRTGRQVELMVCDGWNGLRWVELGLVGAGWECR